MSTETSNPGGNTLTQGCSVAATLNRKRAGSNGNRARRAGKTHGNGQEVETWVHGKAMGRQEILHRIDKRTNAESLRLQMNAEFQDNRTSGLENNEGKVSTRSNKGNVFLVRIRGRLNIGKRITFHSYHAKERDQSGGSCRLSWFSFSWAVQYQNRWFQLQGSNNLVQQTSGK
ncbi:hypothetical protein GALMADRAFT_215133 [Galerina marginata CBS 339.88]|uniref:Uncharacterized protein n=1 Tax=Galerina marginata (strain CBS 339.88) TaxID=685588 RepID=A0A067SEX6_GALM3|nr:hypothetical protein GALMADRAFT_215133 [Galerina marginata CBS 339.88]